VVAVPPVLVMVAETPGWPAAPGGVDDELVPPGSAMELWGAWTFELVMVNASALVVVPLRLVTATVAVFMLLLFPAMSVAVISAVSSVALTNVVGRDDPFQRTVELEMKPVPLTSNVNAASPAVMDEGIRPVRVGGGMSAASYAPMSHWASPLPSPSFGRVSPRVSWVGQEAPVGSVSLTEVLAASMAGLSGGSGKTKKP